MPYRLATAALATSLLLAACGQSPSPSASTGTLSAQALAPGTPDPTFGTNGRVVLGGDPWPQRGIATLPDGTLLVASADGGDFALSRISPRGTVMERRRIDLGGQDAATGVFVQDNGKVVMTGYSGGSFALVRLKRDLRPDPSLGRDGKLVTSLRYDELSPSAVTVQRDGKVLVVGSDHPHGYGRVNYALARFLANGRLDPSFGQGGKVTTHPDPTAELGEYGTYQGNLTAVAVQDDGAIIVGGEANFVEAGYYPSAALLRYSRNGVLDASYGWNGRVWLWGSRFVARVDGLLPQGNGEVVAVGPAYISQCNVARVDRAGLHPQVVNLESSGLAGFTDPMAVAQQKDGKLLLSGCFLYDGNSPAYRDDSRPAVARLKTDLTLDSAFGQGGAVAVPDTGNVLIQPDGKIVVGVSTLTRLLP